MAWLVSEIVSPLARRVGGQAAALLVGAGLASEHESAVGAAIAWAIVAAAELVASAKNRRNYRLGE
jgi:hypothetical protein